MTPDEPGDSAEPTAAPDEPPPILGSWRALYLVLVVELLLITLVSLVLARWAA